ncbi:peptidase [Rhizoctonia solani]|uniref:Peptidase n=1 Tax=Rhizoctonia solani TaxID=456999 RepID=A0A8H7IGW4_9AGAM|nr:peptidase [Rhizoctonia solani]
MIVPTSSTFTQLGNARRLFEKKRMEAQVVGGPSYQLHNGSSGLTNYSRYLLLRYWNQLNKQCFGSRVRWGATFGGYQDIDGSGHGTALAASALCAEAGGTATSASGVAVKILSDSGSGTTSSLISGINWQSNNTNRQIDLQLARWRLEDQPLCYSNTDVSTVSPARVAGAVTVGSIPRSKVRPTNSNYGAGLDVWSFYPIACPTDIPNCNTPTGSVSYVAAYMAVAIGSYGNKAPAGMSAWSSSRMSSMSPQAPRGLDLDFILLQVLIGLGF